MWRGALLAPAPFTLTSPIKGKKSVNTQYTKYGQPLDH
jgi:hypothetical protein